MRKRHGENVDVHYKVEEATQEPHAVLFQLYDIFAKEKGKIRESVNRPQVVIGYWGKSMNRWSIGDFIVTKQLCWLSCG